MLKCRLHRGIRSLYIDTRTHTIAQKDLTTR